MKDLYGFLADHQIEYARHDHLPVFTVEDVNRLVPPLPAAKTKNLFFRDQKGQRHFLVVVGDKKQVNLKELPGLLGVGRLSFGSPDRLKKYLGVDPGAVSLFAIVNDADHEVKVIVDSALWASEAFQFHPLINTSTLVISRDNVRRFLSATGHPIQVLDIPGRNEDI